MLRVIAIYLPQFHPIPENDLWWGKGFTEWTNVAKARKLFKGHYQPHLPGDLGFYDLRVRETREAQAALAKLYGINGFCYYHYWFNGKRLLQRPLDDMIKTKQPDFPFMLCWANENWTRCWDGGDKDILIKQEYSEQDDKEHIHFLINNFFSDSRYIKVNGKPFFLIYRPLIFPNIKKTLACWRREAKKLGLKDLFIGYVQSFGLKKSPEKLGFDCAVEFHPDFSLLPPMKLKPKSNLKNTTRYEHRIVSYRNYISKIIASENSGQKVFKTVCPMWDNSARKPHGATIFKGSTPKLFEKWLKHVVMITRQSRSPEKVIFVNAWNEWGEGNHLEPCQLWGHGYLQSIKNALEIPR